MSSSPIGNLRAINSTYRHFIWIIPKFSSLKLDSKYDSNYVNSFQGVKFHLHLTIETSGCVGIYVRFKKRPIPKYSYYFENSKKESMRQHTAHTIPPDVKRCGHWYVCNRSDIIEFLGNDNVLMVHFLIDNDAIVLKEVPQQKIVSLMWTIPKLYEQNLNPFSSRSFVVGNILVIARLDIKRKTTDLISNPTPDIIQGFVIFLFTQGGVVPLHSIEMVNSTRKVYAEEKMKQDGTPQTLIVEKSIVDENLDLDGALRVKITFFLINPLDMLNPHFPTAPPAVSAKPKNDNAQKTGFFSSKGSYARIDDS